jgi:hypothetical protein
MHYLEDFYPSLCLLTRLPLQNTRMTHRLLIFRRAMLELLLNSYRAKLRRCTANARVTNKHIVIEY